MDTSSKKQTKRTRKKRTRRKWRTSRRKRKRQRSRRQRRRHTNESTADLPAKGDGSSKVVGHIKNGKELPAGSPNKTSQHATRFRLG